MEPVPRPAAQGDTLAERYVLRREAWSSPLGPVWIGTDLVLDRPVFVLCLEPRLAADPGARRAFAKAAARVAQVNHHALLQVYDIGETPAFAVFEHASGQRLSDKLRAGPLRTTEAVRAALGIARALEAMHERGAWHGSLSTYGVLFDEEGRAKVLAAGETETARAATASMRIEQPKTYTPPEPDALPADADRYALAALTFEMLTGRAPTRPPTPARSVRRTIPARIDEILQRALADDPAQRPPLDELEAALAPFARPEAPAPARTARFGGGEFRWLAGVLLILLAGAALVIAGLTIDFSTIGRGDEGGDGKQASETATPAGDALTVREVTDFDPQGDGEEQSAQTGRTIDGDPRSSWETVGYLTASLGGLKDGVGLLFDLGESAEISQVRVQTTREGWTAEVRIGDALGSNPDDLKRVTQFTAGTDTDVPLPKGSAGRYVLIWITKLVDDGSGNKYPFRAAVSEVEIFAA